MDKMKKFFMYALWIILFFLFSNFLIAVGLESNYKDLRRDDDLSQVNIYQAQATKVNGRIRGIVTNSEADDISGKYLEFRFYSKRDVYLGKQYIQIDNLDKDQTQGFEMFFKLKDTSHYEVSIVDEKTNENENIELLPSDWTRPEVLLATALAILIVW